MVKPLEQVEPETSAFQSRPDDSPSLLPASPPELNTCPLVHTHTAPSTQMALEFHVFLTSATPSFSPLILLFYPSSLPPSLSPLLPLSPFQILSLLPPPAPRWVEHSQPPQRPYCRNSTPSLTNGFKCPGKGAVKVIPSPSHIRSSPSMPHTGRCSFVQVPIKL